MERATTRIWAPAMAALCIAAAAQAAEPGVRPYVPDGAVAPLPEVFVPRAWSGIALQGSFRSDSSGAWQFSDAPRVCSVEAGSPADRAGIRHGDIVAAFDGVSMLASDVGKRIARIVPGQTVRWTVIREGVKTDVVVRTIENPGRPGRVRTVDLRREGRLRFQPGIPLDDGRIDELIQMFLRLVWV